jgi:hypothetical protein
MDTKKCSRCSEIKELSDFHKDKKGKFGRNAQCKECRNSESQKAKRREWYQRNKEQRQKKIKEYSLSYKERRKELHKERQSKDINYRLKRSLRSRLYNALKNNLKKSSAVKDIGCSLDYFKSHLESRFKSGMSWDNYGEWHIDHIVPISTFDLSKRSEQLKACHYTNLQPLWADENIKKSNRL